MNPKIDITHMRVPRSGSVRAALDAIERSDVLVGITQSANARQGEAIGNASLLYILTKGSPARHIPPAPVIEPAIAADGNKQVIAADLADAARSQLRSDPATALAALKRAGIAGMNASKAWFTDPRNNWPPNKPATIRRKGSDRRNIDTGALRRALTYVVREDQ